MTTPEAHLKAVAVTEEMVGPSLWLEHRANGSYLVRRSGDVSACLAMLSKEEAAALEAAAQVRSAQDHSGEANEMIGEVERLRALLAQPERQPMGFHERHAVLHARAVAAEARAAKVVEVLAKWQKSGHILLMAGEMTRQELRSVKAVAAGIQREVTVTLLSDHPAPEPGVEAGEVGAAFCWAMDEIDRLSNRLCGFAYPQGMAMLGREDQHEAYVAAVYACRRALQTPADGGRDG